jgi:hypothetical protein
MSIMTEHALIRMAQRGLRIRDAELIELVGSQVEDGFIVLDQDYRQLEADLKRLLEAARRVRGKRLVVAEGHVITAYYPSKRRQRRLLRDAYDSEFET